MRPKYWSYIYLSSVRGLPQLIFPSGHFPRRQAGPASLNIVGDAFLASFNISSAAVRISCCALRQVRKVKKCHSSMAFMVTTMFVVQAFGNT